MERVKIRQVVEEAIQTVRTLRDRPVGEPVRDDTSLLGSQSEFDSLAFVQLIVEVEQRLASNLGMVLSLTDERAMSQRHSPFLTVRSLVEYIERVSQEKPR